ncbi:MAG: hypothetical protein C0392_15595 [Syntrophus sp. (in: bacteria)]|nr:hypothetical protein [Syntrophus sp. (in: bacteria)]
MFIVQSRLLLLLFFYLILQGCVSTSIPVVSRVAVPDVTALPADELSKPLRLDRVVFDVPKGTVLGEKRQGNRCVSPSPLIWEEVLEHDRGDYHREFERIAKQYNFRLAGKPASPIEAKLMRTELRVTAKIVVTAQNICSAGTSGERPIRKGNVRFFVRWEVFSLQAKQVVFVLENESSGVLENFKPYGEDSFYVQAFGNALRGLLSNDEFRDEVLTFG